MPRYVATFPISCMTRQAFEALAQRLTAATNVQDVRLVASFVAGSMVLECAAPDRATLDAWLESEHCTPGSVMRLDIEAKDGAITPL